jgi:hypothetical protein
MLARIHDLPDPGCPKKYKSVNPDLSGGRSDQLRNGVGCF